MTYALISVNIKKLTGLDEVTKINSDILIDFMSCILQVILDDLGLASACFL